MAISRPASSVSATVFRRDGLGVLLALSAGLLVFYVLPLASLVTAQPPGDVAARLGDADVLRAAGVSLATSTATTALAALFGVPLAYALARMEGRWKQILTAAVVLPLIFPPIVSGMLLLTVVGPNTVLGTLAGAAGLPLTRSFGAIVLAQLFVASPFAVVTAKAAFEGIPHALEHASRLLGKSRWTTFRRVTLPLARSGLVAGLTLTFARSIGEFGATIMLAYYPRTMPVQIWVAFTTLGLDHAFPVAVILAGLSIAALLLLTALGANPWTQR